MELNENTDPIVNSEPVNTAQEAIDKEELERELIATEDDIQTLKEALNVKIRRLVEIKKMLGHTDISTISYDVREGLTKISESEAMQKTQRAFLQARSKTIDVAEDVKEKLVTSIETLKQSEAYKNISETMGSAFGTLKAFALPSLSRLTWQGPPGASGSDNQTPSASGAPKHPNTTSAPSSDANKPQQM